MGHAWGPNEQFDTFRNLSKGNKVGQIRSQGTSNMISIACFQRFLIIFRSFFTHSPPKKKPFSHGILRTFFYETGHIPTTKTIDNNSQEISYGSLIIFG